ncbi:MAG: chaperone modulator CbpM [Xanthomonadales bacterium]|nr:chaperone modulator CbpM [Xanthomonadales bacterium]
MNAPKNMDTTLQGEILGKDIILTLEQLCRSCALPQEQILLLVEEGIIEPKALAGGPASDLQIEHWQFHWKSVTRVRTSTRLQQDLGVNLAGVALALELLERIDKLERRLNHQLNHGLGQLS